MKKGFILLIGAAVMLLGGGVIEQEARAQVWQEWATRYNGLGNGMDWVLDMTIDDNSNVIITGFTSGNESGYDYTTVKYTNNGIQSWINNFSNPGPFDDIPYAVDHDLHGNVYVTGRGWQSFATYYDYTTIKYNSNGICEWVQFYNGPGNYWDAALSLILKNNFLYITGSAIYNGSNQSTTIKYNLGGVPQWISNYNSIYTNYSVAISVDDISCACVTGTIESTGLPYDYDILTILNDSSGNQLWADTINGTGNGDDKGVSIAFDSNGDIIMAGYCVDLGSGRDFCTIKYNGIGTQQWINIYNGMGNSNDEPYALAIDVDRNVYVAGSSHGGTTGLDYCVIKYSPAGNQQWVYRYNGPGNGEDVATSLCVDEDLHVYVTGWSFGTNTSLDCATIKLNPLGQEEWIIRYNGPENGNDAAVAISLNSSQDVFIAGHSYAGNQSDNFLTIKYSQTSQVFIDLSPINPPITILPTGGNFSYHVSVTNNSSSVQSCSAWIMVQLPDSTWYGPVLGPLALSLPAGTSLSRQRTQHVPASAPAGSYLYEGRVGSYPDSIWDSDSFSFTKLETCGQMVAFDDWVNSGEDFDLVEEIIELPPQLVNISASATPNPFNPTTTISYKPQAASHVNLQVYDTAGRLVKTLVDGWQEVGTHEITFDGSGLPSGLYIYRIQAGDWTTSGKMVLLK